MIRLDDLMEPCRERRDNDNNEDYQIPAVGVARALLGRTLN